VFAAAAALIVTAYFNRRQATIAAAQRDIASAQKDIAIDKLKHDLFERRYAIYAATKSLIQQVISYSLHPDKADANKLHEMQNQNRRITMFFPERHANLFR
jgi:hypothetical protein